MGINTEDIHPSVGDTDAIGWTATSAGSSVVYKTGWASVEAAKDLQKQLIQRAARIWDVSPGEVDTDDGALFHKSDPELRMTIRELAAVLNTTGGPNVGRAAGDWGGESPGFTVHIVDVGGGPGDGQDSNTSLHRAPGPWDGGSPQLRRRSDAGGARRRA